MFGIDTCNGDNTRERCIDEGNVNLRVDVGV
jgi:hypothetical protein